MRSYQGLSQKEAEQSGKDHGKNQLTPKQRRTFWQTYWGQYDDPIIMVLLIALGINIVFTFFGKVDWHECAGILISVLLSTFVSSLSEHNNENTFQKLQDEAGRIDCKVYRDGTLSELSIGELVVGDVVLLQAGDMVPADGWVLSGNVTVDQSSLSGESKEVKKQGAEKMEGDAVDFWNPHTLYRGSVVCSGECVMQLTTVGDATVYGKLTAETQTVVRESPLSLKLGKLAKSISRFGYFGAILLVIISFLENAVLTQQWNPTLIARYFADTGQVFSDLVSSVIMGIIVIVVAVPEGLPLMIAIVCSLNMKKMLKSKVLVRKLIGIETAGSLNILFLDKTGTITKGKPEVIQFLDGSAEEYATFSSIPDFLQQMVELSVTANTSAYLSGRKIIGGNATEKALLAFVKSRREQPPVIRQIPFKSENKFSAAQIGGDQPCTLVKGAPERLLKACKQCYDKNGKVTSFTGKERLEQTLAKLASRSVRLLALAVSDAPLRGESIPADMIFLGIMAIRDDVRPEARRALREIGGAGIQTVMVTGDRKETAVAVAKEAGLLEQEDALVLTSQELGKLSDERLKELLPKIRVIARALPTDKSRLVAVAQALNLVVGMTGDGVNDAAALKRADVGFAMGSGSEVAKEAGDIVILDDNVFSIRNAVLYGRTIFHSIKKFIRFQLTINVAAVTVSILGPIVGVEKPLDISQMIWTNLMIDSLAAIAFGSEPAMGAYLREKPKRREDPILDREMWSSVIVNGLYICSLSLLFFVLPSIREWFRQGEGDIFFYTGYFTFFIFTCIFNAFNTRTDGIDLLENLSLNKQFITVMSGIAMAQILMTYYGGNILRTAGLSLKEWVLPLVLALTIIPLDLIRKILLQLKKTGNSTKILP